MYLKKLISTQELVKKTSATPKQSSMESISIDVDNIMASIKNQGIQRSNHTIMWTTVFQHMFATFNILNNRVTSFAKSPLSQATENEPISQTVIRMSNIRKKFQSIECQFFGAQEVSPEMYQLMSKCWTEYAVARVPNDKSVWDGVVVGWDSDVFKLRHTEPHLDLSTKEKTSKFAGYFLFEHSQLGLEFGVCVCHCPGTPHESKKIVEHIPQHWVDIPVLILADFNSLEPFEFLPKQGFKLLTPRAPNAVVRHKQTMAVQKRTTPTDGIFIRSKHEKNESENN